MLNSAKMLSRVYVTSESDPNDEGNGFREACFEACVPDLVRLKADCMVMDGISMP
jgi:hypothetical protein